MISALQAIGQRIEVSRAALEHLLPAAHQEPHIDLEVVEPGELRLREVTPVVLGKLLGVGLARAEGDRRADAAEDRRRAPCRRAAPRTGAQA